MCHRNGRSLLIGRNPPSVAGGILDAADSIAPRHIGRLSKSLGANANRAFVSRVNIGNVEIDRGRHRRIGKIAVAKQHMRAADYRLGVELPLCIGRWSMRHLGAESILEKVHEVRLRIQVRRDCRVTGLNMFVGVVHGLLLLDDHFECCYAGIVIPRNSERAAKSSVLNRYGQRAADLQNALDSIDSTVGNYTIGMLTTSVWMAERAR